MGLVNRSAANMLAVVLCASSVQFPTVYAEAADEGIPEKQGEVVADCVDGIGGLVDSSSGDSLSMQLEDSELLLNNDIESSETSEVQWDLDDNGVLMISGRGSMEELATFDLGGGRHYPWDNGQKEIREIIIRDGIINIYTSAFV